MEGLAMKLRYVTAALFAILAIIATTVWATAQALETKAVTPKVITGADIGFRVVGIRGGNTPVGEIVVRVNGEWIEADFATDPRPLR
jgi:hypothetical protein